MAKVHRNDEEREFCRTFISGLIQKGGADLSGVEVWKLLNDRLSKLAREAALAAGLPEEEVERRAREARLTVQTVRGDIRVIVGRAQQAGLAGAAVFLDDQIAAVRDEIESTYAMDEQIVADLERSRSEAWTRTRGNHVKRVVQENGKAVEKVAVEPSEIIRYRQEDGAGNAALYGRLQENMRRRAALRAEERLLRFGRQFVPEPAEDGEGQLVEDASFAEMVMDLDDPERAREAALRLLRRELRDLEKSSRLPLSGDMVRLEAMRVGSLEKRIRSLRDYIRLPEGEEGGASSFEVSYIEIPVRQLPAAPPTESEESDAT